MNFYYGMINEKFNKIICNRIATLRKEKNMTLEQLAYQSGISKGGLSEIERNMKEPRAYTILKICNGLDITISEFFNFNEINVFSSTL
jgi:transcriptional regulator with XRE-family HTH domain